MKKQEKGPEEVKVKKSNFKKVMEFIVKWVFTLFMIPFLLLGLLWGFIVLSFQKGFYKVQRIDRENELFDELTEEDKIIE